MRYAQIRGYDVANGPGIRTVLFVTGCTLNCKNCFNKLYQDFNYGNVFDDAAFNELKDYLLKDEISGLTLLGGEPMENAVELTCILKKLKKSVHKNIWVYSGYTYKEIEKDRVKYDLLKECDVLVDGRYIEALKDLKLKFRGSRNQRIIDIKRTIKENKLVLYNI